MQDKFELAEHIDYILPCLICSHKEDDVYCQDCVWGTNYGQFTESEVVDLMRHELDRRNS